ncbi:MAG: hypothetical protein R3Y56_01220 [Akkermansia sp.]
MNQLIKLCLLCCILLMSPFAQAQLDVRMAPVRQDYMLGEAIALRLTIVNSSDQHLKLTNTDARKWLHFTVSATNCPEGVAALASPRFPELTLTPGSTRTFELNIKPYFNFSRMGNYVITATVRMPDGTSTYSSNRTSINLAYGSSMRCFNIQNKGRKLQLHAKMLHTDNTDCIFGQVIDANSGIALNACYLGRFLNFMTPIIIIDRKQNMHMLCQSTPKYYTYAVMNPDGNRVKYQIYRRTQGPIDLVVTGAGVTIVGAVPHVQVDKNDGFNDVHSATDRIN